MRNGEFPNQVNEVRIFLLPYQLNTIFETNLFGILNKLWKIDKGNINVCSCDIKDHCVLRESDPLVMFVALIISQIDEVGERLPWVQNRKL
jgi:hypothetical protein